MTLPGGALVHDDPRRHELGVVSVTMSSSSLPETVSSTGSSVVVEGAGGRRPATGGEAAPHEASTVAEPPHSRSRPANTQHDAGTQPAAVPRASSFSSGGGLVREGSHEAAPPRPTDSTFVPPPAAGRSSSSLRVKRFRPPDSSSLPSPPPSPPRWSPCASSTTACAGGVPAAPPPAWAPLCRATVASTLASTIAWYCWLLYGEASALIMSQTFLPATPDRLRTSNLIFSAGFLARPVGGLVFGHLADSTRLGRRDVTVIALLLLGVATGLIGLLPSYDHWGGLAPRLLVVLRVLQGVGFAGAWGGAVLIPHEWCGEERKKGLFTAIPQAGLGLGLSLSCLAMAVASQQSDDVLSRRGWRCPQVAGLVVVLPVALYMFMRVGETPELVRARRRKRTVRLPIVEVFVQQWRNILLGLCFLLVEGLMLVMMLGWGLPTIVRYGHIPEHEQFASLAVTTLAMAAFTVLGGWLSDRHGRRKVYLTCSLLLAVSAPPYVSMLVHHLTPSRIWALRTANVLVMGVLYGTMQGAFPALLSDLFPPQLRFTGVSLIYQLSRLGSQAFFPAVADTLLQAGAEHDEGRDSRALYLSLYVGVAGVFSAIAVAMVQVYRPMGPTAHVRDAVACLFSLESGLGAKTGYYGDEEEEDDDDDELQPVPEEDEDEADSCEKKEPCPAKSAGTGKKRMQQRR